MRSVLSVVFFLSSISCFAQDTITQISGYIRDSKTLEPIPYADVVLMPSGLGTLSQSDGSYHLLINGPADSIKFIFLGYKTITKAIEEGKHQSIDVHLIESTLSLGVAVVQGNRKKAPKDTAAIALWRQVVYHKSNNSMIALDGYKYKDYTQVGFDWYHPDKNIIGLKFLLKPLAVVDDYVRTQDNGIQFLPMLIKERISEVKYSKSPRRKKEKILADQTSGMDNETLTDFLGNELEDINPYQDIILLAGKSFISPFASTGNLSYNYFITDSIVDQIPKKYQLTFVGKRKQDFTFLGTAWIEKGSYAIQDFRFEISPHIALNFVKALNGHQSYIQTDQGKWIKEKETLMAMMDVDFFDFGSRKNKDRKNQFRIRKRMLRYDIEINPVFEEDEFEEEKRSFEENANELSDQQWAALRPIQLDSMGFGTYEMIDSIRRTRFYKNMDGLLYTMITSHIRLGPVEAGRYSEFVSYNDIEGYRFKLGLRTTAKYFSKVIQLSGFAAYGLKDKAWKYGAEIKCHLPTKNRKWHMLSGRYYFDYRMLGQKNIDMAPDNFMNVITRSVPLDRLMLIREGSLKYTKEWTWGFFTEFKYRWRRFHSVENAFIFTQNDGNITLPQITSSEIGVRIHWAYDERFWTDNSGFSRASMGTKHPILDLEYTAGIKDFLGGDNTYHKIDFELRHRLTHPLGYTKYQLHLGKIFGDVPYPSMKVHLGNESFMGNAYAFALMNEFEFVSDQYASIWISHHFDGLILNTIPLLNKLKWRTIFIFKALYGSLSEHNSNLYDLPYEIKSPGFYAELGFGIENIFKVMRIDFIWRLTQLDQPSSRSFGINLSFAPKF